MPYWQSKTIGVACGAAVLAVVFACQFVATIATPSSAAEQRQLDDSQRSPKWPTVRAAWLKANPSCAACGTTRKAILSVHHVIPFHVDRSKELDATNLITLCEGQGVNCHLLFGHLMNWSSWNVNVREDAAAWRAKIRNRPTLKKVKVAA